MNNVRAIRSKSKVLYNPSKAIKELNLKVLKTSAFKRLADVVENDAWYLIKFNEQMDISKDYKDIQFESTLKFFAMKDVDTYYANPVYFDNEDNIVQRIVCVASHDDILAELRCKQMEYDVLKGAYEAIEIKYKALKEMVDNLGIREPNK